MSIAFTVNDLGFHPGLEEYRWNPMNATDFSYDPSHGNQRFGERDIVDINIT
jgi:hypothetical protein